MTTYRRKRTRRLPSSLADAIQASLDHALKHHNRGVKRLAELMGVKLDTLYKWIAECRIPMNMLASFENACCSTYVTEYLCAQAHLLAVEIPTGRTVKETDVMALQQSFSDAVSLLIRFYKGDAAQDQTMAELTTLMGEIGWHRANVERAGSPELALFGEEAE